MLAPFMPTLIIISIAFLVILLALGVVVVQVKFSQRCRQDQSKGDVESATGGLSPTGIVAPGHDAAQPRPEAVVDLNETSISSGEEEEEVGEPSTPRCPIVVVLTPPTPVDEESRSSIDSALIWGIDPSFLG